uniref:Non-specific serine/threonine protein kinase n=1 Tax=Rhabditophanes sp. KR3021 TaxID=114890 RepID=A0AC35UC10_9BILA
MSIYCFFVKPLRILFNPQYSQLPKGSDVLKSYIRKRNHPTWTSYFVPYKHIQDDQFSLKHFNFEVDGHNYHVLRVGAFPYIKYHCTKRPYHNLTLENRLFRFITVINLCVPCLLYGIAAIFLIRYTDHVVDKATNKTVPIHFLIKLKKKDPQQTRQENVTIKWRNMASTELSRQDREAKPQMKIGPYVLMHTLGSGTFGKVMLGVYEGTNNKVAVKILNRDKIRSLDVVAKIRKEILNLKDLKHPHIIKLYQVISTPSDIFMFMEYVSGGELFEYIVSHGRLKVSEARRFFQQLISGVDYCHRHKVVHRDLKPENLLLDDKLNLKIVDFGLSNNMIDGDFLASSCGSLNYASPQVISGNLYAGPELDVWGSGVILYSMLVGCLPFDDSSVPLLFKKIKSGVFSIPDYLEKSAVKLLLHMLQVDPMKRATINDILNHEWFKKDLPAYLFPPINESEASIIDIDAVREVCNKYGATEEDVTSALLGDDPHNQLSIAYNLFVDHKAFDANADRLSRMSMDDYYQTPSGNSLKKLELKQRHPETIDNPNKISSTLENVSPVVNSIKSPSFKKAKWHLGIRSQSKPEDIMTEVFRAMKVLNFEWKMLNSFHVIVRKKPVDPCIESSKLSLQLYQVDNKNYLLDFKNLVEDDGHENNGGSSSRHPSISMATRPQFKKSNSLSQGPVMMEIDQNLSPPSSPVSFNKQSQTMQFFLMCSSLIETLSR